MKKLIKQQDGNLTLDLGADDVIYMTQFDSTSQTWQVVTLDVGNVPEAIQKLYELQEVSKRDKKRAA